MAVKIGGEIAYYGLEDFWNSCTEFEQEVMIQSAREGLGSDPNYSPIVGTITRLSETVLQYLWVKLSWAQLKKCYDLADKIVQEGEFRFNDGTLVDKHFFLQSAMKCYYTQRSTREDALELAVSYALRDIELFPKYRPEIIRKFGSVPHIATFHQLAVIYEKLHMYDQALTICESAIKYNLDDLTKGGYAGRIERIKKKMQSI